MLEFLIDHNSISNFIHMCVCVCVCVRARAKKREGNEEVKKYRVNKH